VVVVSGGSVVEVDGAGVDEVGATSTAVVPVVVGEPEETVTPLGFAQAVATSIRPAAIAVLIRKAYEGAVGIYGGFITN
jgi:hypothetical protein